MGYLQLAQILRSPLIRGVLSILMLMVAASQCASPTLPLPPSPAQPAVRIALLSPASGDMATFGRMLRNGSIMAFDAWNSQGGLLGHRLEWSVYDTGCQFETARRAAQQAFDDGLNFMVGPLCSEAAIAAAEFAGAHKMLMLSPTATHPLVTTTGQGQTRPTIFSATFSYALQGQAAAQFAYQTLRLKKAALFFYPGDDYSTTLAGAFAQQFANEGGEIVYQATYTPGDIDFQERLLAIMEAGAEVIYLPAAVTVVNQVARQLDQLEPSQVARLSDTSPILLGSDSWDSTELDLTATTGSYFTTHFVLQSQPAAVQNWAEAYQSTYAAEPTTLVALGYDAAAMVATAIQQAGTFDTATVAKRLAEGTFAGVTGQITFDRQHRAVKPVPVMYNEAGKLKFFASVRITPAD